MWYSPSHFFHVTSTLVHPTALKLVLPKGSTQTSAKPQTTVSVTSDQRYYLEQQPISIDDLEAALKEKLGANPETYIALHVDKSAPFESAVKVMNIAQENNYKIIATAKIRLFTNSSKKGNNRYIDHPYRCVCTYLILGTA